MISQSASPARLIDFFRDELLELELYCRQNPLGNGTAGVDAILTALENAGALTPDSFLKGKRVLRYRREAIHLALEKQSAHFHMVGASVTLLRKEDPKLHWLMDFKPPAAQVGFRLQLFMSFDFFTDAGAEGAAEFRRVARALIEATRPLYAWAHERLDFELTDDPHRESMMAPKKVYQAYWLMYLGPEMVSELGYDRVRSAPVFDREEQEDGGVLILTHESPTEFATEAGRVREARLLSHLRPEIPFEEAMAELRRRDELLKPVERNWDPTIAPIYEMMLEEVPRARRYEEIARLNRTPPPVITEWTSPAWEPREYSEKEREQIERFQGLFAEQFVALLHKQIPDILKQDPSVLPKVDHHLWRFDFPGLYDRDLLDNVLMPAVGGYLGYLMVTNLGGKWVPSSRLEDVQVVVGDRGWLPFLRARNYLRSRQSLLDHSLTQFYFSAAI